LNNPSYEIPVTRKARLLTITLAYIAFISLGLPDGLLGVGWPSIRSTFQLRIDAVGSLLAVFTTGYLISSFSSSHILSRMGVGALLSLSCALTSLSLFGQSLAAAWEVVVAFGLLAGLGAGAIDTGLNIYGARTFSTRVMNWLHACYGIGAATGPLIMTTILVSGRSWRIAYVIVAIAQGLLAISFAITRGRWVTGKDPHDHKTVQPYSQTLRKSAVWLGIAVFFFYTGVEQAGGVWIYSYLTGVHSVQPATAGVWVSIYWASLTVGRIVSGGIAAAVPAPALIRFAMAGLLAAVTLIWLGPGNVFRYVGVALMGFSCAPVFPTLIATTPARLGSSHAANAISFQIASSIVGMSSIPALIGVAANQHGLQVVGPCLLLATALTVACCELMRHVTSPGTPAFRPPKSD
jgi:fucose permease